MVAGLVLQTALMEMLTVRLRIQPVMMLKRRLQTLLEEVEVESLALGHPRVQFLFILCSFLNLF